MNNTVSLPPDHICIAQMKAINQVINNNFRPNALREIEETPFLAIEQPDLVLCYAM